MKKLMLDTHTLLWSIGNSKELSPLMFDYISDSRNEVFVSAVSLWEIALKCSIGKLTLDFEVDEIPELCSIHNGYTLVSKDNKMKFYKNDGLDCIW
jgi:PIN domain nuclease of toxin-antitoxin system